jgi:hypothetical protein
MTLTWQDRRRLVVPPTQAERHNSNQQASGSSPKGVNPPATPIVEATGWQVTPRGEIFLVATTPDPHGAESLESATSLSGTVVSRCQSHSLTTRLLSAIRNWHNDRAQIRAVKHQLK